MGIILISEFTRLGLAADLEIDLDADPTTADVGEWITFNWTDNGGFYKGQINFGDGNITPLASIHANSSIIHEYATEGQYNVTIYAETYGGTSKDTDSILIEIKNNPPQFDISLPSEAFEDEEVNVSVVNLVESDHDLQDGVLSYVYDFADGDPITTNTSSIIHKWNNAGVYKVTITVIDDQGALDQKSQYIHINNKAPDAYFTFAPTSASNNTVSSYYGTYDFRGDIIGEEPEDWEVYDSDDMSLENFIIQPNGDGDLTEWTPSDGGYPPPDDHYSLLDEETPDGNIIYVIGSLYENIYKKDRFEMQSSDVAGGTITKMVIHAYGKQPDLFLPGMMPQPGINPKSNINFRGWKDYKQWNFSNEYSWDTLTWDRLNGSQSDLDNLIVEFRAYTPELATYRHYIDTFYYKVYYTHNMELSVLNETGYYRETLRIYDHDTSEMAWMENNIVSQTHGTIEFYVKSEDATDNAWTLVLYDDSIYGLKIFMENDSWKYINGSPGTLTECGNPSDDQWYWVRLDFCTSGTYLDLSAHQFKLTVDSSESNIYSFNDINEVNKIRFEAGDSAIDMGTAWIDAIGYSWELMYNPGDNKYAVISYPEKTDVQFVANCSDSESDLGPMRYYWDFGDSTSGFGKYVIHSYLESGIYIVNLTCKDDNGLTDWYSQLVVIHNLYPEIMNITCPVGSINITEGETIIFNAQPMDDESDLSRLSYWWDFEGYYFNPYNTSNLESGGWIKPHLYMDDFNGNMYVLVKDSDTAFGYKSVSIDVSNVDPLLSIWDASIIANISFEVYKGSPNDNANFTFDLLSNDESVLTELIDTTGDLSTDKTEIAMTLSKIWKVVVNTSDELPSGSWFRCYVKLNFLSGEELVILSPKLYGDEYGFWEVDINPYFYDNGDYTFMYPTTFDAHIWDPSVDDIALSIQYDVFMHLVIDCDNSLLLEDSFSLDNVDYMINVYTENDVQYVNITASQQVMIDAYNDNNFPVSLDFNFTVYPIIDLYELLEIEMELTNLTILHCDTALNYLIGDVWDDDGGENTLTITFTTDDNIEFENLSPYPQYYFPDQALEGNNVTFYVEISDFDQIREQEDYYVANFKDYDVPTMPDDFDLINGTCDWEGDLFFQDNNLVTFNPNGHYPATWGFEDEVDGSSGTDIEFIDANSDSECPVTIVNEVGGHKKVLDLNDNSAVGNCDPRHVMGSSHFSGTLEYWHRSDDVTDHCAVYLDDLGTGAGPIVAFEQDYYQYHDGSWHTIKSVSDNTWYHIRIDFECGSGGYQGLSADTFYIYIDGTKYGPYNFNTNIDAIDYIRFFTSQGDSNYHNYFDAFGFSWDENYNFGDNIHWENYKDSMSEANFEGDDLYTEGTDINFVDYDLETPNTHIKIVPSFDEHKKVLECYDNSPSRWVIANNFSSNQISGTVEGYVWSTNVGNGYTTYISINKDGYGFSNDGAVIRMNYYKLQRQKSDSSWVDIISSGITANTKYHWRIDFECGSGQYEGLSADTYYLYWDGTKYGPYEFHNGFDNLDSLVLYNGVSAANYYSYYDAIGYSWESDYKIGDNLYGSDKLGFTSTFHLNNVKDDEIIKYLKLFYAYKTDSSALVNISIYNFRYENWMLIDSTDVGTDIYRNKYSILSAEYINDTYDILVKIESDTLIGEFYLDQLKLEYYSSEVSEYGTFDHEFIPELSSDFTLYSGWSDWEGDLNSIDDSYSTFRSCEGKEEVWLMLDEGAGTNAVDSIEQNQNGTIYGASWTSGKLGDYALDFDASSYDYVDVDYNIPNSGYTMCAWYKTTTGGKRNIISEGLVGESQGTNTQELCLFSNTQIGVRTETGYGYNHDYKFTPTGNIIDGNWHFVCAVITSGNLVFYWDDQKFTSSMANTDTTAGNCWIGCYGGPSSGAWFDGAIDDVRIYECTLSDDEIEWLYNNGNGREETCRGLTTGIIRPNGDITTQWSQIGLGDHYTLLDEDTSGDSKYIWTFYDYKIDELDFDSIDYVDAVTKIEIKMYAGKPFTQGDQPMVDIYLDSWQGWKTCSWSTSYTWTSLIWSGLSASQEDLDGFRFKINSNDAYMRIYLETVYAIVTYIPGSGLSVASDLHLDGVRPVDQIDSVELLYSFKTDIDVDIDLCLYNYSSKSWDVVNTSSHTQFTNCSYEIIESDYFSPYYDVRVKFERTDSALFEFYLEKLKLHYEWTKGSYNDDYLYSNYPDYPEDFTIYDGTCESEGCFEVQDNDFYTFNSTANGDLDFYAVLSLESAQPSDLIISLWLNYSYKTDISQTIKISLYNFTANEWYLIDSSTHTSFSNESYNIPITRIEVVNGTEIEYHDFYNANFDIFVRFEGENQASEFQLFLDQLKVEYTVLSYLFVGDSSRLIDAVEGDYISFDSDDSGNIYYGTYSFEDDPVGEDPQGWIVTEQYPEYGWVNVISSYGGHNKVLEFYDEAGSFGIVGATQVFGTRENGTIEFWFKTYDIPLDETHFVLRDTGGSVGPHIVVEAGVWSYYDGSGHIIRAFSPENWYHVRIDFECSSGAYEGLDPDKFYIYIDDQKYGPYSFENEKVNVEEIYIYSEEFNSFIQKNYIDAVGYSWDPDYIIGDNRYAGYIIDETFNFTLELNPHRLGLFESFEVSYSINTSLPQEWSISIYNYTGAEWVVFDSPITDNSLLNKSFVFTSTDFISEDYKVKVRFYGFNSSGNSFTLHIYKLEVKYDWSITHANCGIGSYSLSLQIHYNMSSRYSTMFYEDFMFDYEGTYLITMSSDDGYHTTKTGMVIEVSSLDPFATIGDFVNETIEDKNIHFTSEISIPGSNATKTEYKYFWLFGDGSFSNDPDPIHAYAESGVYNVSLTVIDCFGNSYTVLRNITIAENAPQIVGPYTFYGVEGQAITLDVDIFDAFLDEVNMNYEWFNSTSSLVSTDKKPSIILQDGFYEYTLNVTDSLGQTATADISVIVEDAPPVVIAQNYMYSGASVSGDEGFFAGPADDPGELVLTAYGYDISDNNDLDYHWTVYKGDEKFDGGIDWDNGISSTRKFRVTDTVLYRGEVKIVSAEKSTVTTFLINSFIDDNGNGFSNEFEERLAETGENITAYSDADNDCLSDLYEIGISNTSYLDPDTDGDGLYDGFDPDTGIGEWTVGTDPLDWDCDSDMLSDGIEVIGWKISSELLGEIVVSSDPFDNDTDDEGLSDYDEYYAGTDPRNSDTDNDGADDNIDPHPLKWDGDEDGLCDGLELQLGTNPNNTDTDSDGISDGEEVIGWAFKTNPLTSDSDRDFVADTAEYQNYKVAIDDRYDLYEPVSLSFEVNCEKAMAAQIAFLITFGEAIDEDDKVYGIQDVPDLNVTLYKVDDDLLLFNMTTNSTRYFSQVVDIRETIKNHSLDYRGEYMIKINDTEAGCMLEQFEIDITGYLDPNDEDFDDDGIMDGVEMGLLVKGTDTLNFTDSYWYDNLTVNYFNTKPFIISVEHAEFDIPSGTLKKSVELNSSQDIANCVPFMTKEVIASTSDDWDDIMVDIYFEEGPKITAERNQGGGALSLSIFVVEFDPSFIKVQQGSISFAGTSDTDSIEQVATDKTAMVFYYRHAFDQDDWNDLRVCGYFSASDTLTWERHASSGDVIGHFYVFEAKHDQFTVQSTSFTIGSTSTSATGTLTNAVDMSKSFVIASFKTDRGDDNAQQGSCDVRLDTNTTVKAERYSTSNTITIKAFIVEFSESGAENVQRGVFSYGSTEDQKIADIDYVYLWRSMVHNPVCGGQMRAAQGGSADAMRAWQKLTFENETMIQGDISVGNTGNAATGHWEVIQWDVQTDYDIDPEPISDEFYLEIPDIGRVYDANITVKVESEGTPIGLGKVNITLIKEELNCSIEDVVLIDYFGEFDSNSAFTYENFLDLTDYVNNETILDYYGTYLIEITVFDTNYTHDNFTLSEFYIQTDTYVDAGPMDTNAWYTNPALPDSDFDGWNDYKEIFIEETNPLNVDTDFDGAWDPYDRDPRRDVMLEIKPISGTLLVWGNKPKLQIVIKFKLAGERLAIYTLRHKATVQGNSFAHTFYEWTAYFDGTHNSSNELQYYINIDDDTLVQGNDFEFGLELWLIDGSSFCGVKWDDLIIKDTDIYSINDVGHSEIVNVTKINLPTSLKSEVKLNVSTIGIEKANTIAIYEINDTSFTGHYQEAEKMNIIQLYINDTPSEDSPFVKGPNCIVIPTSLFTETILNGYIQTERLNETALYSSDEEKFKFISIERDGSAKQACEEVDFVLIRFDISYEDAEEILELILTCVVNETLDENNNTIAVNETLYTFVSTKLNGTTAVMLNLPSAALGFVPWFSEKESSPFGSKPEDADDVMERMLEGFCKVVLGIILSPFTLALAIWNMIEDYVLEVIKMFILPILAYILWLIIRAILFVFFYILLAIELLFISVKILAIGVPLLAISLFGEVEVSFGLNWWVPYGKDTCAGYYEILSSDLSLRVESWIVWSYWEFFDLYFPLMSDKTIHDNTTIQENKEGVIDDYSESTYKEVEPKASSVDSPIVLFNHTYNSITDNLYRFEVRYYDANFEEPDLDYGVRLHLICPNGTALNHIQMSTNSSFPDYSDSNGVLFNYTLDISDYEDGLWHYYLSAKDKTTGNLTVYPKSDYLVGPDTCGGSNFLWGSRIAISNESYYNAEGWANEEFYFFVDWWDPESHSTPISVSLCLIPANISIGIGISKNIGIQKFIMQTTASSPNYTNPVEFYTILNFYDLGYTDFDIGTFYHYFEAETSDNRIVNSLDNNGFEFCHFSDPFVKSITSAVIQVISYTSSGSNSFITSETEIEYYLIYSDHSATPPSNLPEISFTCNKETQVYNMTHYYTSSDNCTYNYYFSISGSSLESGRTIVDFNFEDLSGGAIVISSKEDYVKEFFVINFLTSALNTVITTTSMLGTVPISLFSSVIAFARIAGEAGNDKVLLLGGAVLVYAMVAMGSFIYSLTVQEDIGGLLGFSLTCFLLFVMLQVCVHPKGGTAPQGVLEIFNFAKQAGIYFQSVAWIFTIVAALFTGIFPDNSILTGVLYLASNLFVIFPVLIGAFVTAFSLNIVMNLGGPIGDVGTSTGCKLITKCFEIYRWSLFAVGLIGCFILDLILKAKF